MNIQQKVEFDAKFCGKFITCGYYKKEATKTFSKHKLQCSRSLFYTPNSVPVLHKTNNFHPRETTPCVDRLPCITAGLRD